MWQKVYTERSRSGFTLVELLVVVSILSLLGLISYANLRNFRSGQVIEKAASDLQTFLRLAQSNASSRLNCGTQPGATWLVEFRTDQKNVDLKCFTGDPSIDPIFLQKTLTFSGTNIQVNLVQGRGGSTCSTSYPGNMVSVRFAPLYGTVMLIDSDPAGICFSASTTSETAITLKDTQRNTTKVVVVKRGGQVNVE